MSIRVILVFTALTFRSVLFAQEQLSMSDAIQLGLSNNFGIRIEQVNQEIARNNNTWGQAGRYPSIDINVGQSNSITDIDNPASFLQGQIRSNDLNPVVAGRWTIFDGFSIRINKERLDLLEEQSDGNAEIVIENAVQAIVVAYYTVLLEQERTEVLEQVLTLSRDRYNYVLIRKDLGAAVTFDILQDKNSYLTDSSNYVLQELIYQNSMRSLNLLLAEDLTKRFALTGNLDSQSHTYSYQDLYAKMTRNNSNLRNQFISLELLRNTYAQSKAVRSPALDLNFGYSYDKNWQDLSNANFGNESGPPDVIKSRTTNYFANFTLAFTLFDGGRIKRQIKNARIQETMGALQTDELKLLLNNDLLMALDRYNVRIKLLEISAESLDNASLNLQLSEERYKNGTINSFNYRDIQVSYLQAALRNLQSKFDLIQTDTALLRLTGGILDTYQ
jgi:outer membrane protein TolC